MIREESLRRSQIIMVAFGMASIGTSLIAGALEIGWLAVAGLALFFLTLISIFVLLFGLLGVAAVIPVAQVLLARTAQADRSAACGRAGLPSSTCPT